MNLKRFHEKNMHSALQRIREELGDNAVIVSSDQHVNGVEVVAATDYEAVGNGDFVPNNDVYKNSLIGKNDLNEINSEFKSDKQVTNEIDISAIQEELSQLRGIIESQTELISWRKIIAQNTSTRQLLQKLSISGFGFNLS